MSNLENIISSNERIDDINENLKIIQYKDGLTFGTDTYLLSAFARKSKIAIDLGSGTGVATLLSLSHKKFNHAFCVEIQEEFAQLIVRNASLNNFENVAVINKDIRLLTSDDINIPADVVISNPPYMKNNSGFHSNSQKNDIARREIFGTIYDFCKAASKLLKHGGYFYTVYHPDRLADLIYSLKDNNLEPKRMITVYPKIGSSPCIVLVESKKGSESSLKMSKPLIIYDNNYKFTEDMQKIYDEFSVLHLFK